MSAYRAKPPKGCLLQKGDPLAFGLVVAYLLNEKAGVTGAWKFYDAVSPDTVTYTRNNADTLWKSGDHGSAFNFGANGSGTPWTYPARKLSQIGSGLTTSSVSVVGRYAKNGANPNLEITPINNGSSLYSTRRAAGDTAGFILYSTAAAFRFIADGSGLAVGAKYDLAPTANQYYTLGGTYARNTGTATYGGTWTVYLDGIAVGSNNYNIAGSFAGTFTDNIPTPFTYDTSTAPTSDKRVEFLYVYNRCLTAREMADIHADPFRMFRRRNVGLLKASGAAAAAKTPWHLFRQTA